MRRSSSRPAADAPGFGLTGLRRRLLKGLAGHAFNQPLGILIQLVSVPLLLAAWGVQMYGEWLIVMAIPAYLVRSDIGFTTAAYNEIAMQSGRGDRAGAGATFQTCWLVVTASSLVAALLVIVAAHVVPVGAWFGFTALVPAAVAWIVVAPVVRVVINIQTELLNAGFVSAGAYGRGAFMQGLIRLLEFLLRVGAVVIVVAMRRVSPWLHHGVAAANRRTARRLLGPGLGFCGMTVANMLKIQGMVLVVGAVLGPAAVVVYSTLRMLTRSLEQILSTFHSTVQPEIAAAHGQGNMPLMRQLHGGACRVALWLALAAAAGLAVAGPWFVGVWTGGAVAVPGPLYAALIAVMVLNSIWIATLLVLHGLNRSRRLAVANLAIVAVGLGAAAVLGGTMGLTGVGLALLGVEAGMTVTIVNRTLRLLESPLFGFARALARPPVDILRHARGAA